MRVIGGEFKGRRLACPAGRSIRPTSDRVREAIFDILGAQRRFQRVLDLFAGTGSLGIEALSRGAQEAVFIEQGKAAIAALKSNLKALGLGSRCWVIHLPVKKGISLLAERGEVFDLIFIDPPYGEGVVEETLQEVVRREILSPDGVIVVEHATRYAVIPPPRLVIANRRRYGDTTVSFFVAADS